MKYAIILSLAGSSLALPFGNANDAGTLRTLFQPHGVNILTYYSIEYQP